MLLVDDLAAGGTKNLRHTPRGLVTLIKLLTEHHLEFLGLKRGCRGSSESTHVKMPHCWKSHARAHFISSDMRLNQLV